MNLLINDLLSAHHLRALADWLSDSSLFNDGRESAGRLARQVKKNLQIRSGDELAAAQKLIRDAMINHPILRSAARPKSIVRMMANRYDIGMSYGSHIDDPLLDGQRCDLSFTVCLSQHSDYDGGDLVLENDDSTQSFHLGFGQLLLYPSCQLHRVEPITRGSRFALIGWIQSWIADPRQRSILFDLDRVIQTLGVADETANRLQRCRANLIQMWAR